MGIESITANSAVQRPATHDGASQRVAAGKFEAASSADAQPNPSSNQLSKESQPAVAEAVQLLADFVNKTRPELSFSIDEASGVHVVRIVDTTTKEVIRQFPSEEAIQLAQALDKLQGLFVKDKA